MRAARAAAPHTDFWVHHRLADCPVGTSKERMISNYPIQLCMLAGLLLGCIFGAAQQEWLGALAAPFLARSPLTFLWSAEPAANSARGIFLALELQAIIQVSAMLLCGLSACGQALMVGLFAAKGVSVGLCSSAAFGFGGEKSLIALWLLTMLQNITEILVLLWISESALPVCRSLWGALKAQSRRPMMAGTLQKLLLRCGVAAVISTACCLFEAVFVALLHRAFL